MPVKQLLDLSGRAAIITGGSRGLGLQIAEALGEMGAKLALTARKKDELDHAVEHLAKKGVEAHAFACDIGKRDSIPGIFDQMMAKLGRVDILINNAGAVWGAPAEDHPLEAWDKLVGLNLVGNFVMAQQAAKKAMIPAKWGRIVNIASIAGKDGNPNASHYSASKAGLIGLTKSLGKELATSGILVNCITPAAARTEIFDQMKQEHIDFMLSKIPMSRFLQVDEAAAMIAWLSSEDCAFPTGAVFDISGGRAVY